VRSHNRESALKNVVAHNREAWDREAGRNNPATIPVSVDQIAQAARGLTNFSLTGGRRVPPCWLADIAGSDVLCMALGGGQQVPLLAAAGAKVTSVENSPVQLERDRDVARAHGLELECVLADMQEQTLLEGRAFDRCFIGLGMQFIEDPRPVWANAARLLRSGGEVVAAVVNPVQYLFEWPEYADSQFRVVHSLPYSDLDSLTDRERIERFGEHDPIEFGHTFEQVFGGFCDAGFSIDGFFEDVSTTDPFAAHMATFFVIRGRRR
jgi:SAM-dependent methyltransferase